MRIVHLSDVHFGMIPARDADEDHAARPAMSAHFFARSGVPDPVALVRTLRRDSLLQGDLSTQENVTVISGDLGWSGNDSDYEYALKFLETLRDSWPNQPIVIVPGNHDVDRKLIGKCENPQASFVRLLREFYGDDFGRNYPFLEGPDEGLERHRIVSYLHMPEKLLIIGVNSVAHMQPDGTPIYVDPKALELIEDRIISDEVSDRVLRIFVVHHHLFPYAAPIWDGIQDLDFVPDEPDPTIISNSAKLQGWLNSNHFSVVLHGHQHLAHSRDDTLWGLDDHSAGRRLLIVGTGSAGVNVLHIGRSVSLSYNVLEPIRLATRRWLIRINPRRIPIEQIVPKPVPGVPHEVQVGEVDASPPLFMADSMDDCHHAISRLVSPGQKLRNFMSIVGDHRYIHPETAHIGDRRATQDEVWSSFRKLHPEYHPENAWTDSRYVDRMVEDPPNRFQFQHGPRLFGVFGRAGRHIRAIEFANRLRPIRHAVEDLQSSPSRSYVGLYNPEFDVGVKTEPLPGLVGIQFVPDDAFLDVVFTFRKLELSFWWVVNMLEAGKLLEWAASRGPIKRQPRRVVFFAALAEWKDQPEAALMTALDETSVEKICEIVVRAERGEGSAVENLIALLREKVDQTSEVNIDDSGLRRLADVVIGVIDARGEDYVAPANSRINLALYDALNGAAMRTLEAVDGDYSRDLALEKAQAFLKSAIEELERQV